MNKRKKTAKGKVVSEAEKLCCYTEGYGYGDRGLACLDEFCNYDDPCCC
jgi:hypothetical protein